MKAQTNNSPAMIFDSDNGFNVPRLIRDESIPAIEKVEGLTWTPVYTVESQETRLSDLLRSKEIPVYVPMCKTKGPIFAGVVFAALNAETRKLLEKELLVMEIQNVASPAEAEESHSELVFMTMAEQVSRYYPFTYEKSMPASLLAGEVLMPLQINDYGDCRIISNDEKETSQMYFNFRIVKTILKFDLTLYQFRSLLLSRFLFADKYCA